jgi:hypothetical protein
MDSVVGRIEGHIVPTSVVYRDDSFYVGNLDVFPIRDGASKILKISRSGNISCIYIDLTVIPGLAFDRKGRCMVGEYDRKSDAHSRTGKILRIDGKGQYTEIATGRAVPTAMTFGPDGNLNVSNMVLVRRQSG